MLPSMTDSLTVIVRFQPVRFSPFLLSVFISHLMGRLGSQYQQCTTRKLCWSLIYVEAMYQQRRLTHSAPFSLQGAIWRTLLTARELSKTTHYSLHYITRHTTHTCAYTSHYTRYTVTFLPGLHRSTYRYVYFPCSRTVILTTMKGR